MQNKFDPQQTRNDLAFSQGAAQLFGQVANEVAGAQIRKAGWKEDSAEALALHAVIGAAQGAIAGNGSAGSMLAGGLGAAAGTYSAAQLQQYLWQDYLHGGSIRPDSAIGRVVILMASAAVGSGVGALTGVGSGSAGISAILGGSAAASSTLYNQEEPRDEEGQRPVGPDGRSLTDEEIFNAHNYGVAYRELSEIDPENQALQTIAPENYAPTREDVVRLEQALAEARELKSLTTTVEGLQRLIKNAPVGKENVADAAQAALNAEKKQAEDALRPLYTLGRQDNEKHAITFGKNENQEYHTFRHVIGGGYNEKDVQDAISDNIKDLYRFLPDGQYNGSVTVNGVVFNYSAFKFPDGSVNVGRITPPR